MNLLHDIVLVLFFVGYTSCAKILGVFPMTGHSHFTLGFRLMKELADRGHEVTFINHFPQKKKIKNFRDIPLTHIVEEAVEGEGQDEFEFGEMNFIDQLEYTRNFGEFLAENTFKSRNVQNLLQSNETFDLVLLENFITEAFLIFPHRFKCPFVVLAPGPITMFNYHMIANPLPSSYIPNILTDFVPPLSFYERIKNTFYNTAAFLHQHFVCLPRQERIMKKYVKDAPDLKELRYKADLVLSTSHVSFNDPQPLQANVKEIGGYHVQDPQPLPSDIEKYLNDSKEGVILFSMGSHLSCSNFPKEKLNAILKSFAKLKQKVLWKFDGDLLEVPENVRTMKWIPQNDIIAHPNIKVFIGHGGLLSTIEAVYHGVPMVGIPVFWDQKPNIKKAEQRGFAISVPLTELNEEKFTAAIHEVLNNPSYAMNAKLRSRIMHSDPIKQLDAAVFWMEYVLKFKGTPHLKSAGIELRWYQLYNVDIIGLIFIAGVIFVRILYLTVNKIIRIIKFYKSRNNTKVKKQ